MEERENKTIICSVFFLDIVEYSRKSVAEQILLKERFNAFLSIAIRDVPVNDRIILDTGDGAAISFLGDVSDALHAALSMRSSLLGEGVRMEPPLLVRMGINLGPVRLVKDINGQPNIVGDGINVAQRVMGFADPGQILVSRSYYDAVSRLAQEYAGMFHFQGLRTDKHVREHEVYAIGYPGDFTTTQRSLARQARKASATGFDWVLFKLEDAWESLLDVMAHWERRMVEIYRNASKPQRAGIIGGAALTIALLVWLIMALASRPDQPAPVEAKAKDEKKAEVAAAQPEIPPVVVEPPKETRASGKKIQGVKQSLRVRTVTETMGAPAVITLVVQPWGEVYLDGRMQGVSPPLLELQVVPGKHNIKIKNTSFPAYSETVKVKPGENIRIQHTFAK